MSSRNKQSSHEILAREMRMNMKAFDAKYRMQGLSNSFTAMLSWKDLSRVTENSPNLDLQHAWQTINDEHLQNYLLNDRHFYIIIFEITIKSFRLPHVLCPNDFSSQILALLPYYRLEFIQKHLKPIVVSKASNELRLEICTTKLPLMCLYGPHKIKDLRRFLRECPGHPDEEDQRVFEERTKNLEIGRPAKIPVQESHLWKVIAIRKDIPADYQ